jgi:hypothetical protein
MIVNLLLLLLLAHHKGVAVGRLLTPVTWRLLLELQDVVTGLLDRLGSYLFVSQLSISTLEALILLLLFKDCYIKFG